MGELIAFLEALVTGLRRFLRDVVCPVAGLFLVYQLGRGQFETGAIPFVATLTSALIGLPIWLRSDERNRESSEERKRKRKRRITIDWGGNDGEGDGGDDEA